MRVKLRNAINSKPRMFGVIFIMLAGGSTYLLKAAIGKPKDD